VGVVRRVKVAGLLAIWLVFATQHAEVVEAVGDLPVGGAWAAGGGLV